MLGVLFLGIGFVKVNGLGFKFWFVEVFLSCMLLLFFFVRGGFFLVIGGVCFGGEKEIVLLVISNVNLFLMVLMFRNINVKVVLVRSWDCWFCFGGFVGLFKCFGIFVRDFGVFFWEGSWMIVLLNLG